MIKKLIIILLALLWIQSSVAANTTSHKTKVHKKTVLHKRTLSSHHNHKKKNRHYASRTHKRKSHGIHHLGFAHSNDDPGLQANNEAQTTAQKTSSLVAPAEKGEKNNGPHPTSIFSAFLAQSELPLQASANSANTNPQFAEQNLSLTTPSFAASIEQRLVGFVQQSVSSLRYSAYKLGGTHFDTSRGIYIVDCSGYVDNTLRAVYPQAYLSLVDSSGTDKPNTLHYYDFFKGLTNDHNEYWSKVEDVEKLRPGDILVFRYKNSHGRSRSGHVMVVMNQPVRQGNVYLVSVADSASSGHSQDTRSAHVSGVGIGTLLLRINPKTGHPAAFAWKIGSQWRSNVNFAMARPLDFSNEG